MSPLSQALQAFSTWIQTSQTPHAEMIRDGWGCGLNPHAGLEREMIDLYSEEFNFRFPEEVYELYQWCDGEFVVGDVSNPVLFVSLDQAVRHINRENFPYLPIFIGDETFFFVTEATPGQKTSPVYHWNGSPEWGGLMPESGAPSITALMQAVAECATKYDGISHHYMEQEKIPGLKWYGTRIHSELTAIYKKYGIKGNPCGLWR